MNRLILVRHAKAERDSPSGEDFDRGLTESGTHDAVRMGVVLGEAGYLPDAALVSAAERTRRTWDALAKSWGAVETRYEEAMYHASARALRRLVEEAGEACETLVVVGHNPGIHELAVQMLGEGGAPEYERRRAQSRFPTCAAAAFAWRDGRPVFETLLFPEDDQGR